MAGFFCKFLVQNLYTRFFIPLLNGGDKKNSDFTHCSQKIQFFFNQGLGSYQQAAVCVQRRCLRRRYQSVFGDISGRIEKNKSLEKRSGITIASIAFGYPKTTCWVIPNPEQAGQKALKQVSLLCPNFLKEIRTQKFLLVGACRPQAQLNRNQKRI